VASLIDFLFPAPDIGAVMKAIVAVLVSSTLPVVQIRRHHIETARLVAAITAIWIGFAAFRTLR
jgi:hypothetical protein